MEIYINENTGEFCNSTIVPAILENDDSEGTNLTLCNPNNAYRPEQDSGNFQGNSRVAYVHQ